MNLSKAPFSNYFSTPGFKHKAPISFDYIMDCVSHVMGIPKENIMRKSRKRELTEARNLFIILARNCTKATLKRIGDYLDGKDHTTIIHSINTYNNLMDTDDHYRKLYEKTKVLIC